MKMLLSLIVLILFCCPSGCFAEREGFNWIHKNKKAGPAGHQLSVLMPTNADKSNHMRLEAQSTEILNAISNAGGNTGAINEKDKDTTPTKKYSLQTHEQVTRTTGYHERNTLKVTDSSSVVKGATTDSIMKAKDLFVSPKKPSDTKTNENNSDVFITCEEHKKKCVYSFGKVRVTSLLPVWQPMRMAAYFVDLKNSQTDSLCSGPDTAEKTQHGCFINKEKIIMNLIKRILSDISKFVSNRILTRRMDTSRIKLEYSNADVCTRLHQFTEYNNAGMSEADVVLYVTSESVPHAPPDSFAWAFPCVTHQHHLLALAVILNPNKVNEIESIVEAAVHSVLDILGILKCPDSTALLFRGKANDGDTLLTSCMSVDCRDEDKVYVQYKDKKVWEECLEDGVLAQFNGIGTVRCPKYSEVCSIPISSALKKSVMSVACPTLEDICRPRTENAVSSAFYSKWERMKVSIITFYLENLLTYCDGNSGEWNVPQKDAKGNIIDCSDTSEEFSMRKRKELMNHIIPALTSALWKAPFVKQSKKPLESSSFVGKLECEGFSVSSKYIIPTSNGFDAILHIDAAPMQESEKHLSVLVKKCSKSNGEMVNAVVNFNPARILIDKDIVYTSIQKVFEVLGILHCPSDNSMLIHSNVKDGYTSSACVHLNCTNSNDVVIQYENNLEWYSCSNKEKRFDSSAYTPFLPQNVPDYALVMVSGTNEEYENSEGKNRYSSVPRLPETPCRVLSRIVQMTSIVNGSDTSHSYMRTVVIIIENRKNDLLYFVYADVNCKERSRVMLRFQKNESWAECKSGNNIGLFNENILIQLPICDNFCADNNLEVFHGGESALSEIMKKVLNKFNKTPKTTEESIEKDSGLQEQTSEKFEGPRDVNVYAKDDEIREKKKNPQNIQKQNSKDASKNDRRTFTYPISAIIFLFFLLL